MRLLLQNPAAVASLCFLLLILLLAVFAPAIAPFDPNFVNPADRLDPPSSKYWFGTDDLGRDVFSRVIYGARVSLLVGVTVMVGATVLGSLIGLVAGYYPRLDTLFMRVMDGLEAFPSILLALTIMATLGPATENVIVALSVVYTPNIARLVRGTTLMNRQQTYVESARAIGMRDFPIMRRYIFANSLSPLIVQGDVRRRVRDPHRGIALLPRRRRASQDSDVGQHRERRPTQAATGLVDLGLRRLLPLRHGARHQSDRRRLARRARPAVAEAIGAATSAAGRASGPGSNFLNFLNFLGTRNSRKFAPVRSLEAGAVCDCGSEAVARDFSADA